MSIAIGDPVRVKHSFAGVKGGTVGTLRGKTPESVNLVVDVDGRRVGFPPEYLEPVNGRAAETDVSTAATQKPPTRAPTPEAGQDDPAEPKPVVRPAPKPPTAPPGFTLKRVLYLNASDAAAELGVKPPQLKVMSAAIGAGECKRSYCRYTVEDLERLAVLGQVMAENGLKPKEAVAAIKTAVAWADRAEQLRHVLHA